MNRLRKPHAQVPILVCVVLVAIITSCGTSMRPATAPTPIIVRQTNTAGPDSVSPPTTGEETGTTIRPTSFLDRTNSICTAFRTALAALDESAVTFYEDAAAVIASHVSRLDNGQAPADLSQSFNDYISTFIEFRAELGRYSAASSGPNTSAEAVSANALSSLDSTMNADARAIGADACVNIGGAVTPADQASSAPTVPAESSSSAATRSSGDQIIASDASLHIAPISGYEWIPFGQDHPTRSPSTDPILAPITGNYFVGEMRNVRDGSTIRMHMIFLRRGQHWTRNRHQSYSTFELGDLTAPAITPENSISIETADSVIDGYDAGQFTLDALGVTLLAPHGSNLSVLVDQFVDATRSAGQSDG